MRKPLPCDGEPKHGSPTEPQGLNALCHASGPMTLKGFMAHIPKCGSDRMYGIGLQFYRSSGP